MIFFRYRIVSRTLVLALLFVTGCMPHSCSRNESRELYPADSLSREIARQMPEQPLRTVREMDISEAVDHPRTLQLNRSGDRLLVADTGEHQLLEIDLRDASYQIVRASFVHPYLSGSRGDSIAVFNPSASRIDLLIDGSVARSIDLPEPPNADALTYATVTDDAVFLKTVSQRDGSHLLRISPSGQIEARHRLPGPHWRHAGMMRAWGDSLISLSGYRPVVDVLAGTSLDSLTLRGFDSPMLARSRLFASGDLHNAPLLTSSADPEGDHLFVLNMRPGWIQIDAYDRDGLLQQVFVQDSPAPGKRFYPVDLTVRSEPDGTIHAYVLLLEPSPRVLHLQGNLLP